MANFHFFTDIDLLNVQTDEQAFGPVKGKEATQYRVTSLHTSNSNPKAYAVCAGEIQIQEIPNSELVNIILKPSEQGAVDGIKVKYFIYRGILKNTMIGIDTNEIIAKTKSKLSEIIWNNQDVCNSLSAKVGNPSIDILLKTGDAYLNLQDLYKIKTDFVSPCVEQGDHIGIFDKDKIGFEIVVDSITLTEPISIAQTLEHIIEVTENATPPTYAEKAKREQILNYIDPAAFYGMHYYTGIKNANDTKDLYKEIILKAFYNHNVTYIDIRHDTGFSFVYYGDYKDEIFYNNDFFLYSENKWPIYTLRDNLNKYISLNNYILIDFSTLKLSLNITNICVSQGFTFLYGKININPQGKNKFVSNICLPYNIESKNIISSYTKLIFIKSSTNIFNSSHYIDNLFPITEPIRNFTEEKVEIKHIGYEKYVNEQDKILALNEKHILFSNGIYDSCIAFDKNRVTLFAVPKHYHNISGIYHIPETFNDCTVNSKSFLHYTQEKLQGYKLVKCNITSDIQIITLKEELFAEKWEEKFEDQIAIIITKTQYQEILDLISINFNTTYHPVLLQRIFLDGVTQEDIKIDDQKKYKKITLKLAGIDNNGNYKNDIETSIDLYSVDGFIYCSPINTNEYEDIKDVIGIQSFFEGDISIEFTNDLLNDAKLNDIMSVVVDTNSFNKITKFICSNFDKKKILFGISNYKDNAHYIPPGVKINDVIYPSDTITIEFNINYINNANEIAVVSTLFHELMHAYIDSILFKYNIYYVTNYKLFYSENSIVNIPKNYNNLKEFLFKYHKNKDTIDVLMGFDHNYMSSFLRIEIINGTEDYVLLSNLDEVNYIGKFQFIDLINNVVVEKSFNIIDVYNALSWNGLVIGYNEENPPRATNAWRTFTKTNKTNGQFYYLLSYFFSKGELTLVNGITVNNFPFNAPVNTSLYIPDLNILDTI